MPNTNGHGPRRAVLYARVSTDEQARSGYSLAQQMEALRAYAAREGYEVLEEGGEEQAREAPQGPRREPDRQPHATLRISLHHRAGTLRTR